MTPPSSTAPANQALLRNELKMLDWVHLTVPPAPAMFAQLLVGLINGAFYAMLSLGPAGISYAAGRGKPPGTSRAAAGRPAEATTAAAPGAP